MTYCVVPRDLARKLYRTLERFYRDDPSVEVVVEQRSGERRGAERRDESFAEALAAPDDRRRVRNRGGRRVGDRRCAEAPALHLPLPRRARPFMERLKFVQGIALSPEDLEDLDTAQLLTRVQAGERDPLRQLYHRYFDRIYTYLRMTIDDCHDVEETTQEVFEDVIASLPEYGEGARLFRPWLFARARQVAGGPLPIEEELRAEVAHEPRETDLESLTWLKDQELVFLIRRLPPAQREVMTLSYVASLNAPDIARVLGCWPAEVVRLHELALASLSATVAAASRVPAYGERLALRRRRAQTPVLRARRLALRP